ncbi:hypothetical protein BH23PLA1_BH23PLA1_37130 [soil metagenome]
MELQEALNQISQIRRQMARVEVFRGYRAVPVAGSGLLAIVAAGLQAAWIEKPTERMPEYLALWLGAAGISLLWALVEMARRARRASDPWAKRVTWMALEQFLPCLVAGGLLTFALVRSAPGVLWMLPGLWQVLFSLGIFASIRLLPRATFWVAVFYMVSGVVGLAMGPGGSALAPWTMGLPFGVGQLLAAAVLYWTLERSDVETDR